VDNREAAGKYARAARQSKRRRPLPPRRNTPRTKASKPAPPFDRAPSRRHARRDKRWDRRADRATPARWTARPMRSIHRGDTDRPIVRPPVKPASRQRPRRSRDGVGETRARTNSSGPYSLANFRRRRLSLTTGVANRSSLTFSARSAAVRYRRRMRRLSTLKPRAARRTLALSRAPAPAERTAGVRSFRRRGGQATRGRYLPLSVIK
jgi:hypothetical protein